MTSTSVVEPGLPAGAAVAARKKRADWIEIARVIATGIVVLAHVGYTTTFDLYEALFLGARVPFFFFISGFLTRSKKLQDSSCFSWRRAGLLALPFFAWQTLVMGVALAQWISFPDISLDTITWRKWIHYSLVYPVDAPLWFLRDLIFLSFFSPLLLRLRAKLFFFAVAIWVFDDFFGPRFYLLPRSWGYYLFGLGLSKYSVEWIGAHVKRTSWSSVWLVVLLTIGIVHYGKVMRHNSLAFGYTGHHGASYTAALSIVGMIALARVSIGIEERFPHWGKRIANLGMSSFLVYAANYPVLMLLQPSLKAMGIEDTTRWGVVSYIYPLFILVIFYTVGHLMYLFLRKYLPWTLPVFAARRIPEKKAA